MTTPLVKTMPRTTTALALVCAAFAGCARLGEPLDRFPLPESAPAAAGILRDLAENEPRLRNFRALGTFTLVCPERAGVERFRRSSIVFRKPSNLHIVGRRGPLSTTVFVLTCVGSEFLIEFKTEKEYYWNVEGERFDSVSFSVSPSDVAREMFEPERWSELRTRNVRVTEFDADKQTATVEIMDSGIRRRLRRRVVVSGLPWRVVRSERFDKRGNVIAVVDKTGYREMNGFYFPSKISARFPGENTEMDFDMHQIEVNTQIEQSIFDIEAIRRRVEQLGHVRVEYREAQ